jgi:hypothetical protein
MRVAGYQQHMFRSSALKKHPGPLKRNNEKCVTLTAHNPDLNTVTIPFAFHTFAAAGSHCRVFLSGQNPYARTHLAGTPHRAPHSPHQPPPHRLSAHSALSAHVFPKTFPRRRPPHLRTAIITLDTHMTPVTRRRHRDTKLRGITPMKDHRCPGRNSPPAYHPPNFMRTVR